MISSPESQIQDIIARAPPRLTLGANPRQGEYGPAQRAVCDASDSAAAQQTIARWPGYRPSSLASRPGLAKALDVASIQLKLEGERFTVGSFKALGPPYALERELGRRGGGTKLTAVAATSGNQGRALAWGAKRLGVRAAIFMAAHASEGRAEAIRKLGGDVIRVSGDFRAAQEGAAELSAQPDHVAITELPSEEGNARIVRDMLAGYTLVGAEISAQCAQAMPTHVFVAAGNGVLTAGVCAGLWLNHGADRPRVIAVEPTSSDGVGRSLASGRPAHITEKMESVMDGLVVPRASTTGWPIIRDGLDAAIAIDDAIAIWALRQLAAGSWGDAKLPVGETGIAATAGMIAAALHAPTRASLGIDKQSRLLAIVCEGVTDQAVFDSLVAAD
jgi:diaminopropionate ammonia-lyase